MLLFSSRFMKYLGWANQSLYALSAQSTPFFQSFIKMGFNTPPQAKFMYTYMYLQTIIVSFKEPNESCATHLGKLWNKTINKYPHDLIINSATERVSIRLMTTRLKSRRGVEFPGADTALKIPARLMFFRTSGSYLCVTYLFRWIL